MGDEKCIVTILLRNYLTRFPLVTGICNQRDRFYFIVTALFVPFRRNENYKRYPPSFYTLTLDGDPHESKHAAGNTYYSIVKL
jgi:hypothetical protein